MKILTDNQWQEGLLDYYRHPSQYRIKILAIQNLKKLDQLYFVRAYRLNSVWNYLKEVGIRQVLRKVISRRKEKWRNIKYLSCGIGKITETSNENIFSVGQWVAFVAPCHPACFERIVLPDALIAKIDPRPFKNIFDEKKIFYGHVFSENFQNLHLGKYAGWNFYSGKPLDALKEADVTKIMSYFSNMQKNSFQEFQVDENTSVVEKTPSQSLRHSDRKRAVLLGYGNYAKSVILPNIEKFLDLECIHEVDPTQINRVSPHRYGLDTSPELRPKEKYDACFIAGFHHLHAPLAVEALRKGICTIVEKPLAVNREQLRSLLDAMESSAGRLFAGFQKRWSPFNEMAWKDLNVKRGDAVSYHCIVYEVPLPDLHWYRWPNSRSRIVSNGCHWIDHFLYLNDFCDVTSLKAFRAKDGTINCSAELRNGAFFSMVLTDKGSARIGVQDYVELRANGATVKIINDSKYQSEDGERILNSKRINKTKNYARMYRQIGKWIIENQSGESMHAVKSSVELTLAMEDALMRNGDDIITDGRELLELKTHGLVR
jgi:predicted dehydrogenase